MNHQMDEFSRSGILATSFELGFEFMMKTAKLLHLLISFGWPCAASFMTPALTEKKQKHDQTPNHQKITISRTNIFSVVFIVFIEPYIFSVLLDS